MHDFLSVLTYFTPPPPKPAFDLFLTYFIVSGVSGLLGGLLLLNLCELVSYHLGVK